MLGGKPHAGGTSSGESTILKGRPFVESEVLCSEGGTLLRGRRYAGGKGCYLGTETSAGVGAQATQRCEGPAGIMD